MVVESKIENIRLTGIEFKEIEELFHKLDVNNDGQIDVKDLTVAFKRLEVSQFPGHAKVTQVTIDLY